MTERLNWTETALRGNSRMTPVVTAPDTSNTKDNFGSHQRLNGCDSSLFYWSRVDLQCCVSLRCTAKRFRYRYTYIYSFLGFFPHLVVTEYCVEFSVLLCSRALLTAYLIYSGVCVHPKLLLYPSPPWFPFGNHKFVLCKFVSVLWISSFTSCFLKS